MAPWARQGKTKRPKTTQVLEKAGDPWRGERLCSTSRLGQEPQI